MLKSGGLVHGVESIYFLFSSILRIWRRLSGLAERVGLQYATSLGIVDLAEEIPEWKKRERTMSSFILYVTQYTTKGCENGY